MVSISQTPTTKPSEPHHHSEPPYIAVHYQRADVEEREARCYGMTTAAVLDSDGGHGFALERRAVHEKDVAAVPASGYHAGTPSVTVVCAHVEADYHRRCAGSHRWGRAIGNQT